jgi:hypothetical protein
MGEATTPTAGCTRLAAPDRHPPKEPVPEALCPFTVHRPASPSHAHPTMAAAASPI